MKFFHSSELKFETVKRFHGLGIFKNLPKPWLLLLEIFANWILIKMSGLLIVKLIELISNNIFKRFKSIYFTNDMCTCKIVKIF